jgi:hypothetical protein
MYVATVPNRSSPPAILLREGYREGGKVKTRTLANISHWPAAKIDALRRLLRDETPLPGSADRFKLLRSLPHGHVAAVLGTARRIGLDRLIASSRGPARRASLALALVVGRVIEPGSKLAAVRRLNGTDTASTSLGPLLGLGTVDEHEIYDALDWLLANQGRIERSLAKRHLKNGMLVLYDLTSTWFEGRCCPLARLGHSRDDKKGKLQIVFGLLCTPDGCPVAVEVFEGNTGDPNTLKAQIDKLKRSFGLDRVVLVGDRGMITSARLDNDVRQAGLDWITALRGPTIRVLVDQGSLQLSLFDERDLAEITSPDFPGERLIACRNPFLAEERARKREELLVATEKALARVTAATRRKQKPLRGRDAIALKLGEVINQKKMAKHFDLIITDDGFTATRKTAQVEQEARLDGIYVIRTCLPHDTLDGSDTVGAYKQLAQVERAFRSMKTVDIEVRPIHHRLADRVRAHVFLCMLAYYLEWHMRKALAPILFDDHDPAGARALRNTIVAPARRSPAALRKAATKKTADGLPVHSFRTLLADLGTFTRNVMVMADSPEASFTLYPEATAVQARAFELLDVAAKL